MKPIIVFMLLITLAGCATTPWAGSAPNAESALAFLRKQLESVHANGDAAAFAALHTDATVVEWRGRSEPLTGRVALENSRREIWAHRRDLRLSLQVSELRIHADRAYEFGSYEESWLDSQGTQLTEFGRYVTAYARETDGQWRIARTFGFTDLTASRKTKE
jgi:ketosteroid isomerase-like protein